MVLDRVVSDVSADKLRQFLAVNTVHYLKRDASPGVRKYTYDIAHDSTGSEYSVNFNPSVSELHPPDNFLNHSPGFHRPLVKHSQRDAPAEFHQYAVNPDYDEQIHLKVKPLSPHEMEKSSKDIQSVHSAYSKGLERPLKPMNFEVFDLGLMGYGDFMDSPDAGPSASPQPAPIVNTAPRPEFPQQPEIPDDNSKPIKFQAQTKVPYSPPKKFTFPKAEDPKAFVPKVQKPKLHYGFKPLEEQREEFSKELFTPHFDDGHLKNLGDKAFSKVFMAQGHAKAVPMVYSERDRQMDVPDFSKALFVPVFLLPNSEQDLMGSSHTKFSSPSLFSGNTR
ncbi:hypothetical protein J6590_028054 [Homalodisca vitripennis]|nr:hypothetical protein J6590_028054 [Homalodisca vitripennis]